MATKEKAKKKKLARGITSGIAHIQASFNNTIVTITDAQVSDAPIDILGSTVPTGSAIAFRADLTQADLDSYVVNVTVDAVDGEVEPFEVELKCT